MYLTHFALDTYPFTLAPDPEFFFGGRGHHEALNTLLVALRTGEGFVKITGEVGTGKTLLCRTLLTKVEASYQTAYIPNPMLTPRQLFLALAEELELAVPAGDNPHVLHKALHAVLVDAAREGRPVLLCIDEAQAMPTPTLEALRLLSNLETEKRKLVQIVLFGQPELDERLAGHDLRQLRQRIGFSYRLPPLDQKAVRGYITCRLKAAGSDRVDLFLPGATRLVARASRGVPRLINILCHKALMAAFGRGDARVRPRHVTAAIRDTEGVTVPLQLRWLPLLLTVTVALAAGELLALWYLARSGA